MNTFEGYSVWSVTPGMGVDVDLVNPREILGEGWQHRVRTALEKTERALTLRLLSKTAAARATVRDFFDARFGSYRPFWVRSYKADYVLAQAASATDTTIYVVPSGEIVGIDDLAKRYVYSADHDTGYQVSNATTVGSDTRLDVSPALASDLAEGAILENLYFVRCASDLLEFEYLCTQVGGEHMTQAVLMCRELQRETP